MRLTVAICLLGLVLCASGCGGVITDDMIAQLDPSMSLGEVEAIMGPGRVVNSPPEPEPFVPRRMPEDMRARLASRPKTVYPPGLDWRLWGSDSSHLCLGFQSGKIRYTIYRNITGRMKGASKSLEPDGP
jgi:hypothetical protein